MFGPFGDGTPGLFQTSVGPAMGPDSMCFYFGKYGGNTVHNLDQCLKSIPCSGCDLKLSQLMKKLSQNKQDKLQDFVDYLRKINAEDEVEQPPQPAASKDEIAAPVAKPAQEIELSQVSQDEFGLPKVPLSDASSDLELGKPLPISKQEIRKTKGTFDMKRPASHKRPAAAKAKASGKSKASKPSSLKRPAGNEKEHVPKDPAEQEGEVQLFATFGTDQSYICAKDGNKKKLWVAVSKRQSLHHADLVKKIYHNNPKSKAEALNFRQKFLDAQDAVDVD